MKTLTTVKQKSFTLIELIAVLLILGILAAVAVPKYIDLVEESERKACEGVVANMNGLENTMWAKFKLDGTYVEANEATLIGSAVIASADSSPDFTVTATSVSYTTGVGTITISRVPSDYENPGYWTF